MIDQLLADPKPTVGADAPLGQLAAKLVAVMAAVATVPKRGHNTFHNYDYVTEADVAEAVRHAMVEAKVVMVPSLVEIREREVTTRSNKSETVTTVIMDYLFVDAETGASLRFRMPGSGQDVGDKGLAKAITAATKYAQLKAFQLSTGDDPEADGPGERMDPEPGSDDGEGQGGWASDPDAWGSPDSDDPAAPAPADCISEGKVKRVYALLQEAAKRTREPMEQIRQRTLEKVRAELHVQKIEHIPWKGNGYQRLCDWIEAQGRK
jgi:ERF superfamily